MKKHQILPLFLTVVLLIGCGTPKVWYQEGKSFETTRRDLAAARVEALRSYNPLAALNMGFFFAAEAVKKDLINNWMTANGYSLVNKNSLPSGVTGVPECRGEEVPECRGDDCEPGR